MKEGLVILHKPIGLSSRDAVDRVCQLCGVKKAGHAGTLDPAAEGVLPIALGKGTKYLEFLQHVDKAYIARITFGARTDTYDADGQLMGDAVHSYLGLEDLLEALTTLKGRIQQSPPPYSSVKAQGMTLHRLARRGKYVQLPPRTVEIRRLEPLDWENPHLLLWIECSSGTYVRSLANDLGRKIGIGAYLSYLLRARHGPFYLDEAVSLEQLTKASDEGWIQDLILPPEEVLASRTVAVVDEEQAQLLRKGSPLAMAVANSHEEIVALTARGSAAAVMVQKGPDLWHPRKVFSTPT